MDFSEEAVEFFEDQEEAEERFHKACTNIVLENVLLKKRKQKLLKDKTLKWLATRKGPTHCRLCGQDMSLPGEYRAIDDIKVTCWKCYEEMPNCIHCGKGKGKQVCRECFNRK